MHKILSLRERNANYQRTMRSSRGQRRGSKVNKEKWIIRMGLHQRNRYSHQRIQNLLGLPLRKISLYILIQQLVIIFPPKIVPLLSNQAAFSTFRSCASQHFLWNILGFFIVCILRFSLCLYTTVLVFLSLLSKSALRLHCNLGLNKKWLQHFLYLKSNNKPSQFINGNWPGYYLTMIKLLPGCRFLCWLSWVWPLNKYNDKIGRPPL